MESANPEIAEKIRTEADYFERNAKRGLVDLFNTHGALVRRLQAGLWGRAPWGVALAPQDSQRSLGRSLPSFHSKASGTSESGHSHSHIASLSFSS
jgi:hypothetical protein